MKKRKGNHLARVVALAASLALVVGLMPAPALAVAGASDANAEPAANASCKLKAQSLRAGVTQQEGVDLAKKLVAHAIHMDPQGAAQTALTWASGKLLDEMFGADAVDSPATLDDVLSAIDQLSDQISTVQTTLNSQALDEVLNTFKGTFARRTTDLVYGSLKDVDEKQAKGEYAEAQAAQIVRNTLTETLGVTPSTDTTPGDEGSVEHNYDLYVQSLWRAMTDAHHVTMNGKAQDLTLMQIWYEHLRNKYHWEHQAYEEWGVFQAKCVTLLMTSLTLEKASLQTRIQMIKEWNEQHNASRNYKACEDLLAWTQDCINQISGYSGKDAKGNDVNYPGLFSEATWASQYWMYKERPEYRYYWTPGHEILFYAQVNTQDVPREAKGVGSNDSDAGGYNYWTSGYLGAVAHHSVKFDFWKPFVRYKGGNTLLASEDQLRQIYKDYGSSKHLYNIFIDKSEGNFVGLDEKGMDYWWFVVDPDSDHRLFYDEYTFKADQLCCYVLKSANMKLETSVLCYYHYGSNEPNKHRHYIGVGVKRVGPETDGYGAVVPDAAAECHTGTESESALWWPSCDDLAIGYDSAAQGGVVSATMDDSAIDASSYKVQGNSFVLSKSYMSGLEFGEHELLLTCENGTHHVSFLIKQKQDIAVQGAVEKTYGDVDSFNLGAKGTEGNTLAYKSSNKKVAMVDAEGEVVVRGAGTANITVTASETDEYAPAIATVTVKVNKAKNPVTLAKKTAKVKYAKLKKAAQKVAIGKAKKAQGKVTYSIAKAVKGKKSFKKKFSISKKTGKITVKKGLKKGTYKVTVKAKAAGNANYKSGSKKAVITVKVK